MGGFNFGIESAKKLRWMNTTTEHKIGGKLGELSKDGRKMDIGFVVVTSTNAVDVSKLMKDVVALHEQYKDKETSK